MQTTFVKPFSEWTKSDFRILVEHWCQMGLIQKSEGENLKEDLTGRHFEKLRNEFVSKPRKGLTERFIDIGMSKETSIKLMEEVAHHRKELFAFPNQNLNELRESFEKSKDIAQLGEFMSTVAAISDHIYKTEANIIHQELEELKRKNDRISHEKIVQGETLLANAINVYPEANIKGKILRIKQAAKILVLGNCNSGKSTFLNAFLRQDNLLPVSDGPCTSEIIELHYGEKCEFRKYDDGNGEWKPVQHNTLNLEATKQDDGNFAGFDPRNPIQLRVKADVLRYCTLFDSPGLGDEEDYTRSVLDVANSMDLVVIIVDGTSCLGESNKKLIKKLNEQRKLKNPELGLGSVFFVCNKTDMVENPEAKQDVILKEVKSVYPEIDTKSQLHFVNSKLALDSFTKDYLPIPNNFRQTEKTLLLHIDKVIQERIKVYYNEVLESLKSILSFINMMGQSNENKKSVKDIFALEIAQSRKNLDSYQKECELFINETERDLRDVIRAFWKVNPTRVTPGNYENMLDEYIIQDKQFAGKIKECEQLIRKHRVLIDIDKRLSRIAQGIGAPDMLAAIVGTGLAIIGVTLGVGLIGAMSSIGLIAASASGVMVAVTYYKQLDSWREEEKSEVRIEKLARDYMNHYRNLVEMAVAEYQAKLNESETWLQTWSMNSRSKEEIEKMYGEKRRQVTGLLKKISAILKQEFKV